jgi:hypothetical protein
MGGQALRVTIRNFVAAAKLVRPDQAECFDDGGRLYIREPASVFVFSAERSPSGERAPHETVFTP